MALKDDIKNKVKAILDEKFKITEIGYVPKIDDPKLTFGNTALKFTATVLAIDMRGSTDVLNRHQSRTVGKLHMAFFHTIVKIANSLSGNVRSFNGDSALIFFPGDTKNTLSRAVKCAMQIKYMIDNDNGGINNMLKRYSELDFGIGLDHGEILCTKVGIGGQHNRDLFWIGNSVNKATKLSDESGEPNHISISGFVHHNLEDWARYGQKKNYRGETVKADMWSRSKFDYNDETEHYYYTSWHWGF